MPKRGSREGASRCCGEVGASSAHPRGGRPMSTAAMRIGPEMIQRPNRLKWSKPVRRVVCLRLASYVSGPLIRGSPTDVIGEELKVGQKAPDFSLVAQDLSNVSLGDTHGKVRIISTVPSLDTPVCATETRRWQEEADKLGDKVDIITVS